MFSRRLHPVIRVIAVVAIILAALVSRSPSRIMLAWGVVLLVMSVGSRALAAHLRFCMTVLGPIGVGLFVTWGLIVGAPPSQSPHSNPLGGLLFASTIISRLLVISAVFQAFFLSLTPQELIQSAYTIGIRGEWFLIFLGAIVVLPDLRLRTTQIYDAYRARGLMDSRSILDRLRCLSYVLRGVFAWMIRSSLQRAEVWERRGIVKQPELWTWKGHRSTLLEIIILSASLLFLGGESLLLWRR